MKPFDLERAKNGAAICTRDGRPVELIAHIPSADDNCRVVAKVGSQVNVYYDDGRFHSYKKVAADLLMVPQTQRITLWTRHYKTKFGDYGSISRADKDHDDLTDSESGMWDSPAEKWLGPAFETVYEVEE